MVLVNVICRPDKYSFLEITSFRFATHNGCGSGGEAVHHADDQGEWGGDEGAPHGQGDCKLLCAQALSLCAGKSLAVRLELFRYAPLMMMITGG